MYPNKQMCISPDVCLRLRDDVEGVDSGVVKSVTGTKRLKAGRIPSVVIMVTLNTTASLGECMRCFTLAGKPYGRSRLRATFIYEFYSEV